MDWLLKQNEGMQSRSQAVGMWQVLVDEGILVHGRNPVHLTPVCVNTRTPTYHHVGLTHNSAGFLLYFHKNSSPILAFSKYILIIVSQAALKNFLSST